MTKENKKQEHFEEGEGLEIIPPGEKVELIKETKEDSAVSIDKEEIKVKKSGNLVVGNLNLVLNPFRKRREKYYRDSSWHLIADIILVILIIILAVSLFFLNRNKERDLVYLELKANQSEIYSGAEASFDLNYKANIKADNSSVQILVPDNFIITSVSPNNLFDPISNSLSLGNLELNSSGQIKLKGLVQGEANDQQTLSFLFNCSQCGRNGLKNSYFFNIEGPAIEMESSLDPVLYLEAESDGEIKLINRTNNEYKDLKLGLGEDLNLREADFPLKDNRIVIDELRAREEKTLNFIASAKREGDLNLSPSLDFKVLDHELNFKKKALTLSVQAPDLNLSLKTDKNLVSLGEKIPYTIHYQNKGSETIKNIKIELISANPNFSITNPTLLSRGSFSLNGKTIIIDDLVADESGQINLELSFDQRQIQANQNLSLRANIEYELKNQTIKQQAQSGNTQVRSQISASARAYYYSPQGDQLGVGPLPPAVDMATNYWVFLEFNNIGNDLENLSLTANLPDNVYFSDNKRVLDGKLIYSEIAKRLVWEVSDLKGGSSNFRANLELSLIPGSSDLGKVLNLMENIKLTVYDKFTKESLELNLKDISTKLEYDHLSSGSGQVVKIK
ncbi:MAG: hypothetical protein ACOXZ1_02200 [Patescibacteria group bacterium]|jgi:hypothetical protein